MNVVQSSATPARTSRTVKSAEERRRNILDAALRLFAVKGFADTTVNDIASEAGMATGTVYLYFPSKEHVLLGLHQRLHDDGFARVVDLGADAVERANAGERIDYRDVVNAILDGVAGYYAENRELVSVCTRYQPQIEAGSKPSSEDHAQLIAMALAEAVRLRLVELADPEMTARIIDTAIGQNLLRIITFGEPGDLERFMTAAKEMINKTLAPTAGSTPRAQKARGASQRARGVR